VFLVRSSASERPLPDQPYWISPATGTASNAGQPDLPMSPA